MPHTVPRARHEGGPTDAVVDPVRPSPDPAKQRRAALTVNALGFSSYYVLLPVVPLLGADYGNTVVAGASTAAFMGATVVTQLFAPRLTAVYGPATVLAAGSLALGVPSLFYGVGHQVLAFFILTTVRGGGFGVITAVGSATVMQCTTERDRGKQLGVYGLVSSLPSVVLPALGVRLHAGGHEEASFLACGVLALAALPFTAMLQSLPRVHRARAHTGIWTALRRSRLRNAPLVFLPFSIAYGGVFTFIPLWHRRSWLALTMFAVTFTFARLLVGRVLVAVGTARMLRLTVVVGVLAGLGLAWLGDPLLTVAAALMGAAVGSAATTTLFALTAVARVEEHAVGAAVWSIAFDMGIGVGALGLALVAGLGHAAVFVMVAALIAASALGLRTATSGTTTHA